MFSKMGQKGDPEKLHLGKSELDTSRNVVSKHGLEDINNQISHQLRIMSQLYAACDDKRNEIVYLQKFSNWKDIFLA
jgi:hypothetical protein